MRLQSSLIRKLRPLIGETRPGEQHTHTQRKKVYFIHIIPCLSFCFCALYVISYISAPLTHFHTTLSVAREDKLRFHTVDKIIILLMLVAGDNFFYFGYMSNLGKKMISNLSQFCFSEFITTLDNRTFLKWVYVVCQMSYVFKHSHLKLLETETKTKKINKSKEADHFCVCLIFQKSSAR